MPESLTKSEVFGRLGRDIAGNWEAASQREWLVTNGIGGYAAGTVAGANTRRYHGILVASLHPPVDRVVLVAKVEVTVGYLGLQYDLSANEFDDGAIEPKGFTHIESFRLESGTPVWNFTLSDALVELRIYMAQGLNTSYVGLRVLRASAPLQISLTPLCTYRDYHSHARGTRPFEVISAASSCSVQAFESAKTLHLSVSQGRFEPGSDWYWNFFHRQESNRGLDTTEDLFRPGRFTATLEAEQQMFFMSSCEPAAPSATAAVPLSSAVAQSAGGSSTTLPVAAPPWIHQLARATDQFLVQRTVDSRIGRSVIAGYPWFADWGRDTMISLPGLTSALGKHSIAADVLRTFSQFIDRGMLPNRFPDRGETPEFNTADASLWFFQAVNEATVASGDAALGRELYPTLIDIIRAHVAGTRYGIQVDASDGLLRAGEPGVQLTWMDAKVGDWVITPRAGKAVEINALWLNALKITLQLAKTRRDVKGKDLCSALLALGTTNFGKFWNEGAGCLFDVIDVDGGRENDPSLRPNQLFAVSLPYSALCPAQMKSVVETCARDLLTSYGLRSLSPTHPSYVGKYRGDPRSRDAAYHQGTVWAWLLGPFALAHYRVYQDAALAQAYLEPIGMHLRDAGIGTVSEIFDGDAPHEPRGCVAQAWSVAEILRSWIYLETARLAPPGESK